MSLMTIHALEDLGYSVDPAQADTYRIPTGGRRLRGKGRHVGKDVYSGPIVQLSSVAKPGREEEFNKQREAHRRRRRDTANVE